MTANLTVAEAYEKWMVPGMFRRWTERVVDLAAPQPGERVLDVACGTGIGARVAAKAVGPEGRLVGIDIDPGVVEHAAEFTRGDSRFEWHSGSALELPFGDGKFDLCLCLQGLQFFPDRIKGLAEMRRVLRRGGRLAASLWAEQADNKGHHAVVRALERQNVDASASKRACSFSDPREIRSAAEQAGFSNIELRTESGESQYASIEAFLDGMQYGSPSTRKSIALLSDAARAWFRQEVAAELQQYMRGGMLAYPMRTHIVIAYA
jgi:ubiquinone/menaquinone biosynthesis C-methylase UbiE